MDPFSEPISKLSDAVIYVIKTTSSFKPELRQLTNTLERISPIIDDIRNQNLKLDRTGYEQDMFIKEIEDARKVVEKCSTIKWNLYKRFKHSLKLKDASQTLLNFFQIEVQADQWRDIKKTLVEVNSVSERLKSLEVEHTSSRSVSSETEHVKYAATSERKKLGWSVPSLPKGIVGFEEPLKELKDKVLSDINDSCGVGKVVVVSAAGGCGKTTLVKMLCNDPQIQDNFGGNVFFVTVSETPDFLVSVNDFFNPNTFDQQVKFQGSEDAKNKLESFLSEKLTGPILLVLDDVWHESYIENFEFDIEGYKLLVTSRMIFPKYDVFKFYPLSDEHAKILFRNSARPMPTIDENLVDQMVKCCKNHPLTLSVVGGSLNGKNEVAWKSMLKSLSQGHLVLDLNHNVLNRLERSFEALEDKFKQCFLDLGLFLEDQMIQASALLDMWVHLYNHDDEGVDTLAKIYELSYRNLVDFVTRRSSFKEEQHALVNYCKHQSVTQHDLLRELAINLNSKLHVAKRPRLIISVQNDLLITNVQGEDKIASIEQIQEPMQARILSISTGVSFSSRWCNMRAPDVEVLVLNLKSETYTLPHFMKEMQKLKILNVTNYGFRETKFIDFHLLGCLSNLTRIRFAAVEISSLSRSTLALANLQKISFMNCKMRNAFDELTTDSLNVWPRLVEIEIDYCDDFAFFPRILCCCVYLKKLSITNCHSLWLFPEDFGNLTSLETLILRLCVNLERLPESITKLQKLNILDISGCTKLIKLPEQMGHLGGQIKIFMSYSTRVDIESIQDQPNVEVVFVYSGLSEIMAKSRMLFINALNPL